MPEEELNQIPEEDEDDIVVEGAGISASPEPEVEPSEEEEVVEEPQEPEEEEAADVESTEPEPKGEEEVPQEETPEDEPPDLEAARTELERYQAELEKIRSETKAEKEKAAYWRDEKKKARRDFFTDEDEYPEETAPEEPQVAVGDRPNAEDFETNEEYYEALADWKADQKIAAYEQRQEQRKAMQEMDAFKMEVRRKGTEKYEDFEEVALADAVPISPMMVEMMQSLENPHDVAYYLGRNPHECIKINRLTPPKMAIELVRIGNKISAEDASGNHNPQPKPKPAPVSRAPAPVEPVGGSGSTPVEKDPEEMTDAEYRAWREKGGGESPYQF